jgi:Domain of unknown function (DUF4192)
MPAKQPGSQQHASIDVKHDAGEQLAGARIRVNCPADLLAVVPFMLGFEPAESVVIIGTREHEVAVTLRYDIPGPGPARLVARHAADILGEQGIHTACAVGYGPGQDVTPVADALRSQFAEAQVTVSELLRVQDGRYWSYLCAETACCPVEGTPFDLESHPLTLRMREEGQPALASREALVATLAPAGGRLAATMRKATARAHADVARAVAGLNAAGKPVTRDRFTATLGQLAVRDAIARYRDDGEVSAKTAAWLTVALRQLRVRDDAWARMDTEYRAAHLRLWTDLTRLARPGYVAAPASLLAFCAWQDGNGALANVALDRALEDNPNYSMATLLRQALDSGAPPKMARLPMTPEEVAEAYDAPGKDARTRPAGRSAGGPRPAGDASEADGPGPATGGAAASAAD